MKDILDFKGFLKIAGDCFIRLFFSSLACLFIYFIANVVIGTWDSNFAPEIMNPIISKILMIKLIVIENLKYITITFIFLNLWSFCITYKIANRYISIPKYILFISSSLIVLLFFILIFNLIVESYLYCFIVAIVMFIYVIVSDFNRFSMRKNSSKKFSNENQLEIDFNN